MEIGIKEIGLSSSILNKIVIDNEADSFEFKLEIKIDGSLIYTTTLYCNDGGYASLYDLGSIVGHHMRMFIKRTVRLQVAAIFAKHTDTADVTVVYSELRFPFFSDLHPFSFPHNSYLLHDSTHRSTEDILCQPHKTKPTHHIQRRFPPQ